MYILNVEPKELLKYGFIERDSNWSIRYIKNYNEMDIRLENDLKHFYVSLNNHGEYYLDEIDESFSNYAQLLLNDKQKIVKLIEQMKKDKIIIKEEE